MKIKVREGYASDDDNVQWSVFPAYFTDEDIFKIVRLQRYKVHPLTNDLDYSPTGLMFSNGGRIKRVGKRALYTHTFMLDC